MSTALPRKGRTSTVCPATLLLISVLTAAIADAHDARPLSVTIVEQTTGVYRAAVRVPPTIDARNSPRIVWPDACDSTDDTSSLAGGQLLLRCAGGLGGLPIAIAYPIYNPSITAMFRVESVNGAVRTAVLPPDELQWVVPTEPGRLTVARDYTALGFEHIWAGPDHLLFVAGLLVLARRPRRIVLAVTGFTIAHSLTLSVAALGLVRIPVAEVEAMIALSILFLAVEIARDDNAGFSQRFPVVLSFVFGLLHGFGFASALGEIGLPGNELVTGLLFFNIGVELGQLAFIGVVLGLVAVWNTATIRLQRPWRTASLTRVGAYLLGIPAAYWVFERMSTALIA